MNRILMLLLVAFSFSVEAGTSTPASWHHLNKISKVSIVGTSVVVRGTNPTGHACVDQSSFYGTVTISNIQTNFSEFYSMALAGYTAGKSMSCHITSERSDGVCEMTNCHLK